MGVSLLLGVSRSSLLDTASTNPTLTPLQAQVDAAVDATKSQFLSPSFLAATLIGGMSYLGTELGFQKWSRSVLSRFEGRFFQVVGMGRAEGKLLWFVKDANPFAFRARLIQMASKPAAMLVGSSVSEFAHRSLSGMMEGNENPHLWKWNGEGGIKSGWIRSLLTFGPSLYLGDKAGGVTFRWAAQRHPRAAFPLAFGTFFLGLISSDSILNQFADRWSPPEVLEKKGGETALNIPISQKLFRFSAENRD